MNMNGAHWHLIVNHISAILIPVGLVVLAVAMKRRSVELRMFAAVLFVVSGVFGWVADETGGKAAQEIAATDESLHPYIHEHAEAAEFAEASGLLIAALAIAMEVAVRAKPKWALLIQWILLIAAIHGTTVYARTAYLGGLIRHPEIRPV